nr:uncharacterized protein LOC113721940 [Coffea arabica]
MEVNQMATAINRITDILERLAERQEPVPVNQPGGQDRGEDRTLERFLKFNPPKFIGEPDPEFLPPLVQEKREDEFIKVKQGASSVAEYEGKFTRLSRYAPELVATKRRRIRRFVQGLNVEIQEGLAAAQISTFTEALEKAQRVESARLQVKDFHAKKRGTSSHPLGQADKGAPPSKKEKGTGGIETSGTQKKTQSRGGHNGRDQPRETPPSGQPVAPQVICGYCRKPNHTENECWKKTGKCLYCGSTEHQIANCPSIPNEGGSTQRLEKSTAKQSSAGGSRSKAPARVYALGYQQVSNPVKVIEGMIFAFYCLVKVLSDYSTTHTFTKS